MKLLRSSDGYTFVELMIVLALIGLLTLVLVVSSGSGIKTQRFADAVRDFTNTIKTAQTQSYTVNSGSTLNPCGTTGKTFWRGNLLEFDANVPANNSQYILSGCDVSAFASNNQQLGITGKGDPKAYDMTKAGIKIKSIQYGALPACVPPAPCSVSLAFLAPDGRMYSEQPIVPSANYGANSSPFTRTGKVIIQLSDLNGSPLVGVVTIDPTTGNISSIVQ